MNTSSNNQECYDLAVVGGGIGGLSLAALAQRAGLRTVLCESHTKLGGCAGYFQRGPYTFDCGATALMGLAPGEPIHELLNRVGLKFESVNTPEYRICLPDIELHLTNNSGNWDESIRSAFPNLGENAVRFWHAQEAIGTRMFKASRGLPRLPLRSFGDIVHNLKILGLGGSLCAATTLVTVQDLFKVLGLNHDTRFRALVAMLLQDTAQAGPETVPLANAAACLQAYRLGLSRPAGSMRALAEGLGQAFAHWGGDLRTATIVDSVLPLKNLSYGNSSFLVQTRRGHRIQARQVAFNLPLDLCQKLTAPELLRHNLRSKTARTEAQWSAFTAYAALEADAIGPHKALFHHVLQDYAKPIHDGNNVLISLSPEGDSGYAPNDVRVATMSTHVRPQEWANLVPEVYKNLKKDYSKTMLDALRRAFPEVDGKIRHIEFATPRSFARYTRRSLGRVGGPPVSRRRANLMAVDSGVLGRGLWVVGDSVFPGQGTMAVVMCAMRVLERITGKKWYDDLPRNDQRTTGPEADNHLS